jgi:hypothetical protein
MAYIKLVNNCPRHPKIVGLSDKGFRWWVNGLCYASEFLTDGFLPPTFLATVPAKARAELLQAGLWVVDGEETRVHDYLDHQTSKGQVEVERERLRDFRNKQKPGTPYVRRTNDVQTPDEHSTNDVQTPDVQRTYDVKKVEGRSTEQEQEQDQGARALLVPPQVSVEVLSEPPRYPRGRPGILSGNASPGRWGLNHANHVGGFCDWKCLMADDFAQFATALGGEDKALAWCQSVRASGVIPTKKPWEFWHEQFDKAHAESDVDVWVRERTAKDAKKHQRG